jgi:gamma-glutamyltranspeptidase/glutathione hydrolase
MSIFRRAGALVLAFQFSFVWASNESIAPESDTGWQHPEQVVADEALVVSAHPLATEAGFDILQRGGTALDAAIAIQAMLTLVEPQSSGIGGGAFLLYWDHSSQTLHAYDGRETAPMGVSETLFLQPDGSAMPWQEALVGGRSVGVPGVLRMLELAHQRHGKLAWSELFEAAIAQAERGFPVGNRLHRLIAERVNPGLGRYPASRQYFFDASGAPLPTGMRLRNPELAQSLRLIAAQGADALYRGPLADKILASVAAAKDNPGQLRRTDLARYRAREREPVCLPYREYRVCGFPPPTSGGVTLLQILGLLQHTAIGELPPDSVEFAHLFTQASRLAYADRARYLADPEFVEVPTTALLDPAYLRQRATLIDPERDRGPAQAGQPVALARADDRSPELPSTSHFVIRDAEGNLLSMTSSIEMAFGSTLMAGGFLLNNQLTDFSFIPEVDGIPVANRVEPGKRPRSSMAPVIVFDGDNRPVAALGSPGGSRIINYVALRLLLMLHTDLPLQEILYQPNISNRNGDTELEQGTPAEQLLFELRERGHRVTIRELNSGVHALRRRADGRWESGVDPRREGKALGR